MAFACAHVEPGQDLSRFDRLGELIVERKPDTIVNLGDFVTVDSLTHWDQNKRLLMEGRRYSQDLEAGRESWNRIMDPIRHYNEDRRRKKLSLYKPRLIYCLGNHEDRVNRYVEQHPELVGEIDVVDNLRLDPQPEIVEYKDNFSIGGVAFTHAVIDEGGKPIAGKYALRRAADRLGTSCIFGHTHRLETLSVKRHGECALQVSMVGTFSEEIPRYAEGALNTNWQGCVLVHHTGVGRYDLETFSIERMQSGLLR